MHVFADVFLYKIDSQQAGGAGGTPHPLPYQIYITNHRNMNKNI